MVEAARIELASGNIPSGFLHAKTDLREFASHLCPVKTPEKLLRIYLTMLSCDWIT